MDRLIYLQRSLLLPQNNQNYDHLTSKLGKNIDSHALREVVWYRVVHLCLLYFTLAHVYCPHITHVYARLRDT